MKSSQMLSDAEANVAYKLLQQMRLQSAYPKSHAVRGRRMKGLRKVRVNTSTPLDAILTFHSVPLPQFVLL
jgi:hypothetical protein